MNKKKPKAKPPIKKKAKTSPASKIIKKAKSKKPKVSEEELLQVLDKITKKLIHKFRFGYHSAEDMKQQASIFALEALDRYDGKRPLENFLWTHVRNRLFNYKRDNYQRPDKPCLTCPLYDKGCKQTSSGCLEYSNKNDCELYSSWLNRNSTKKNLMYLHTIDEVKNYGSAFVSDDNLFMDQISTSEIIKLIDQHLVGEERTIYLKLKAGSKIPKADMTKLSIKLKEIIKNHG